MTVKADDINITLIAAMNYRRVLGDGEKLLWKNREDLNHFKEMTEGHVLVMGRRTYDSLPFEGGFPNRWNIVISRTPLFADTTTLRNAGGVINALALARDMAADLSNRFDKTHKVFCVGGGEVYRAALEHADRILLTTIPNDLEGNVTFPVFEQDSSWVLEKQEVGDTRQDGSANIYTVWERNQNTA